MSAAQSFEDRIFEEILFEKNRKSVPADFPALPEVPGGRYTRQDFYDLEIAHVFRKSWVLAAMEEDLPTAGSYRRFEKLAGSPILLVRGRDGQVRAFYNTCRHRGAPVVKDAAGKCNVLRCQYHSWAYDFEGRLVQVPDEADFPGLDKADRGLLPVRCETYRGLIFVNEDADAVPLLEQMGQLADEWALTGLDDYRVDYRWSRIVNCNWKCALDAFQEVYHINTLHPKTVGASLDYKAAAMGLLPNGNSRMCVRLADSDLERQPGAAPWPQGNIYRLTSVAQTLWPCLNIPWSTTGGKFMMFWPRSVGQCEIEVIGVGTDWGEGPLPADRAASNTIFDSILMEDIENLEAIQASLDSGAFTGMMLGYQERRIYWSHEEIDRRIGRANVPPEIAVEQVLGRLVEPRSVK